jgi:hypothetical protein
MWFQTALVAVLSLSVGSLDTAPSPARAALHSPAIDASDGSAGGTGEALRLVQDVGRPGVGVEPGPGAGRPGVGIAPGAGAGAAGPGVRPGTPANRGGPVNRAGRR